MSKQAGFESQDRLGNFSVQNSCLSILIGCQAFIKKCVIEQGVIFLLLSCFLSEKLTQREAGKCPYLTKMYPFPIGSAKLRQNLKSFIFQFYENSFESLFGIFKYGLNSERVLNLKTNWFLWLILQKNYSLKTLCRESRVVENNLKIFLVFLLPSTCLSSIFLDATINISIERKS